MRQRRRRRLPTVIACPSRRRLPPTTAQTRSMLSVSVSPTTPQVTLLLPWGHEAISVARLRSSHSNSAAPRMVQMHSEVKFEVHWIDTLPGCTSMSMTMMIMIPGMKHIPGISVEIAREAATSSELALSTMISPETSIFGGSHYSRQWIAL